MEEPFSRVIVDCVGPLPRTKAGHKYIQTIMCAATRFPEAIPLRAISAKKIVEVVINFFSKVGLPRVIQTDQGLNFMSKLFRQAIEQLGVQHVKFCAYHPQSQGALERFHATMKNMLHAHCLEHQKEWDQGLPFILFAAREAIQESLGFSPFEMIFGHSVRGPLKLIKERWTENELLPRTMTEYVAKMRKNLANARELARKYLRNTQRRMKKRYDKRTIVREFREGDEVLMFTPRKVQPFDGRFQGPYVIEKRVDNLNYLVKTPDRRKRTQLYHINRLKSYVRRGTDKMIMIGAKIPEKGADNYFAKENCAKAEPPVKLENSVILRDLKKKFSHLSNRESKELSKLITKYQRLIF